MTIQQFLIHFFLACFQIYPGGDPRVPVLLQSGQSQGQPQPHRPAISAILQQTGCSADQVDGDTLLKRRAWDEVMSKRFL